MQKGFSKILILVIILAIIAGGVFVWRYWLGGLTAEVPVDLEIEYGWGACHADWGRNALKITAEGDVTFKRYFGDSYEEKEYNFSKEELKKVYREIVKNNFFELKEKYYNPNVWDGSCSELRIKAEAQEHKVSISNEKVRQIDKITAKILEILNSKDNNLEAW